MTCDLQAPVPQYSFHNGRWPVSGLSIVMLTGSIANRSITQSRECLKRKVCDTQVGEDCCVRDGCARRQQHWCAGTWKSISFSSTGIYRTLKLWEGDQVLRGYLDKILVFLSQTCWCSGAIPALCWGLSDRAPESKPESSLAKLVLSHPLSLLSTIRQTQKGYVVMWVEKW